MTPRAAARRGADVLGGLTSLQKAGALVVTLFLAGASVAYAWGPFQPLPGQVSALQARTDSLSSLPARVARLEALQLAERAGRDSLLGYVRWLACREEARDAGQPPREYCIRRMSDPLRAIGPQE